MYTAPNEVITKIRDEYVEVKKNIARLEVALTANSFEDDIYKQLNQHQLIAMRNYASALLNKIAFITDPEQIREKLAAGIDPIGTSEPIETVEGEVVQGG